MPDERRYVYQAEIVITVPKHANKPHDEDVAEQAMDDFCRRLFPIESTVANVTARVRQRFDA